MPKTGPLNHLVGRKEKFRILVRKTKKTYDLTASDISQVN